MAEPQDKLLSNAGGLLMLAGGLATLTGGLYGLARQEPGIVVLSILLLIGYGVVGYLLMSRGARHFNVALPGAAVLVLATLFLFRRTPTSDFGGRFFLDPALAPTTRTVAHALGRTIHSRRTKAFHTGA